MLFAVIFWMPIALFIRLTRWKFSTCLKNLFRPWTRARYRRRDALIAAGDWDHSMLRYARQFAAADKILVGAPYWDLAFPAQLKVYVENICVCGVTFGYTESGQAGLCAARKLLYVTTAGGPVGDNLGAQYLRALCNMLGIPEFLSVEAENLDVIGVDWQASLRAASNELQALAANF